MTGSTVHERLRAASDEAERLHARSRRLLVDAVREGERAGLTQREIATAVGRSQPEVSRLLRFHGSTPLGRRVEAHRREIVAELRTAGARSVSVFGSVASGSDGEGSDLDLLVDFAATPGLLDLARLEQRVAAIVGAPVDIVSSAGLRSRSAPRIRAEAVPL